MRIEGSVSEVASSRDLPSVSAAHVAELGVRNISDQDVSNMPSFSAPLVVAGRTEPTPDGASLVPYPTVWERTQEGRLLQLRLPVLLPLPHISFSDLLMTVRVVECSGRIPDLFLESLRGSVVFSVEYDFAISGDSLVESLREFRACIVDPMSPLPGPSQGGDMFPVFCVRWWVGSPQPPPRWLGLPMFACPGVSGVGVSPAAVISSSFFLPTAPSIPVSRPLPPPGFSPISSLFSACFFFFSPFSTSGFPCLLLPPVSSAMPSFPVPSVCSSSSLL